MTTNALPATSSTNAATKSGVTSVPVNANSGGGPGGDVSTGAGVALAGGAWGGTRARVRVGATVTTTVADTVSTLSLMEATHGHRTSNCWGRDAT